MSEVKLYLGDCLDVMREMDADSVDSIVTDPPYGLEFMGKEWDRLDVRQPGDANYTTNDTPAGRSKVRYSSSPSYGGGVGAGMQDWHYQWAVAALRVAKPGAYLLAFGGTRTHHRLMCAIEDAGWEIRDVIMWVYGSGFPKSLDVSKAIDKAAGIAVSNDGYVPNGKNNTHGEGWGEGRKSHITASATSDAARWQGWGTAFKPAWEPIIVARKPLIGTVAANVLKYGTGAINIDGCRVQYVNEAPPDLEHWRKTSGGWKNTSTAGVVPNDNSKGRWPANLILTYAEDEYMLRHDVTTEQQRELYAWLAENA